MPTKGLNDHEFAKNSRILKAFTRAETTLAQFSSLTDQLLSPQLARDELIPPLIKGTSL